MLWCVRRLTASDLDDALELSQLAGWNQTREDWDRLLRLEPDGCFAIERDGKVVATATAVRYGTDLSWIGMVLTHPDWRGRGLASELLAAVLDTTSDVRCRMLDATAIGKPIYSRLGFHDLCPVQRWAGQPGSATSESQLGAPDWELDYQAFGAKRTHLLARLGQPYVVPGAHAYTRSGAIARYLGPCVASSPTDATALAEACFSAHPGQSWYWDLLPYNQLAVSVATAYGFRPVRELFRMYTGKVPPLRMDLTYAIAGFEVG